MATLIFEKVLRMFQTFFGNFNTSPPSLAVTPKKKVNSPSYHSPPILRPRASRKRKASR